MVRNFKERFNGNLAQILKERNTSIDQLFSEIKDAKEVQVKVNPKDYEFIKENFSGQNVKISADEAISAGGAIVLSDAGNLEGTIEARLEKIKKIIGQ